MSYASKLGRARINARSPQAAGVCDRCGFVVNFVDLIWQYEWRGPSLENIRILVCRNCLDVPQENVRAIVVPADPMPIINARVQDYVSAATDYHTISAPQVVDPTTGIPIPPSTTLVTQDGQNMVEQPIGVPTGLEQYAVPPLFDGVKYRVQIPIVSIISLGTAVVSVTCSAPHNLSTNDQIAVSGTLNRLSDGFFSVTVTSATAFTYQTNTFIPSGSLLGPSTLVVTALVGLPYNFDQIPATGP